MIIAGTLTWLAEGLPREAKNKERPQEADHLHGGVMQSRASSGEAANRAEAVLEISSNHWPYSTGTLIRLVLASLLLLLSYRSCDCHPADHGDSCGGTYSSYCKSGLTCCIERWSWANSRTCQFLPACRYRMAEVEPCDPHIDKPCQEGLQCGPDSNASHNAGWNCKTCKQVCVNNPAEWCFRDGKCVCCASGQVCINNQCTSAPPGSGPYLDAGTGDGTTTPDSSPLDGAPE